MSSSAGCLTITEASLNVFICKQGRHKGYLVKNCQKYNQINFILLCTGMHKKAGYLHQEAWGQSMRKHCAHICRRKGVVLASMLPSMACLWGRPEWKNRNTEHVACLYKHYNHLGVLGCWYTPDHSLMSWKWRNVVMHQNLQPVQSYPAAAHDHYCEVDVPETPKDDTIDQYIVLSIQDKT